MAAAPAPARADCGIVLDWNDVRYDRLAVAAPAAGRILGRGVLLGCDDGNGPRSPDRRVVVRTLRGIVPRYAVTDGTHVFADRAYPLRLRQHPLHAAVYGHRRWPTCRPTRHLTVVGEFESLHDVLRIDAERPPSALYVDDRTRMAPHLGPLRAGDRVRVAAAECRFAGGPSVPFARTLTVLARGSGEREEDPNVAFGVAFAAAVFALGFAVRALRRRRAGGDGRTA